MTGFAQGALAILAVCGVFLYATLHGLPAETVRSMGFLALVCANYALIFANRSFSASPLAGFARPNPSLWVSVAAAAAALAAIFRIPALAAFLHLGAAAGRPSPVHRGGGSAARGSGGQARGAPIVGGRQVAVRARSVRRFAGATPKCHRSARLQVARCTVW